jgi:hypothetical protein
MGERCAGSPGDVSALTLADTGIVIDSGGCLTGLTPTGPG